MLSTVLAKNNIRLACHINSPAISWHRAHICSCQLQSFLPFLPKASLLFYIGEIYLTQVHSVKKTAPKASERRRTNCKQRSHAKKNCIQIRLQFFAQIHLEKRLLPVFSSPLLLLFLWKRRTPPLARVSFLLCPKWIFYFILIGPYSIYATLEQKTRFLSENDHFN